MTLIVETGGGASNSDAFCSLEYAAIYNSGHLDGELWLEEDVAVQEKAIRLATRRINDGWVFHGRRRSQQQALEWPRVGVRDQGGWVIPSNIIPTALRDATAELARRIVTDFNAGSLSDDSNTGAVKAVKLGPIGIEFDTLEGAKSQPEIPDDVASMLRHLGYQVRGESRMGTYIR